MKPLIDWTTLSPVARGFEAHFPGGHVVRVQALEPRLIRVLALRGGAPRLDRTWCVDPDGRTPVEGRERLSIDGFAGCDPLVDLDAGTLTTEDLRVTALRPFGLRWEARTPEGWRVFAEDRPLRAVQLGVSDHAFAHARRHRTGDRVWGLGEKAGPMERTGRRYEMRNLDAMGYDAESTDPLYKHIPYLLTRTADAGWFSVFYDTLAPMWLDVAQEIDNYHPRAVTARATDGDLDYYVRWAETPRPLVEAQSRLTGGVAFPPRWSLGHLGSTMQYTDAEDAQARLEGYLDKLALHDIPCSGFHMSSGYTAIAGKRYVFNWNHDRVPDPEGLAARFNAAGVPLVANIKPCMLHDHPLYAEAAQKGLFIRDSETGEPERSVFWDDVGSHLDFTNPATRDWWKHNVTAQLLGLGIAATWNDNNEYEVWDRGARCFGFGREIPIDLIRPVHGLLMLRSSVEAQAAHDPESRPYAITRAGCAGLQAHGVTWSGDNFTAWKTLRWNQRMGLGLALSGISNTGHDVGGFSGPQPGPELLARWVQNGALHPRFTIHSWNADGSVTEPWTHPEALPVIRDAIRLRMRLLPYLYTLLWRAHAACAPMMQPPFLAFPDDPALLDDGDEFMLGEDLLVATVLDEGARTRTLRLPAGADWWTLDGAARHGGGRVVTVDAPLEAIPLFARAGAMVPMADGAEIRLAVFPQDAGVSTAQVYDDDGRAALWRDDHLVIDLTLTCGPDALDIEARASGTRRPAWDRLALDLPPGEHRPLRVNGRPAEAIILADL